MKRDTLQGIPLQQLSPQLEVRRTDLPKCPPSHAGVPAITRPAIPVIVNGINPGYSPSTEPSQSGCALYGTAALDSPFRTDPDKSLPVQEEPEEDGADEHNGNQEQERDRRTPGGSKYGRSARRHEPEVSDPWRQHHSTASPTPSSDLLSEGYDPRYDARQGCNGHGNHSQAQRKNSDEGKQKHDGDDEDRAQNSNRTQSQDEESYTPRSPKNNKRNNNISDTKPRCLIFEAETARWMHTFDPAAFQDTLEQHIGHQPDQNQRPYSSAQINSPCHMTSPHQIHSPSHEEPDHFLDGPAAAYYHDHGYPHSPMTTHSRPGAPIPPTPHTAPLLSHRAARCMKPVLPPYSPAPPVGSPYLYSFGHMRRGRSYGGSYNPTVDLSQIDPNVVREQLALQMQIYALNNGGMVSGFYFYF
ncbi:hypothetical protein V8E53_000014 [Lactarius tabidus]